MRGIKFVVVQGCYVADVAVRVFFSSVGLVNCECGSADIAEQKWQGRRDIPNMAVQVWR